MSNTQHLVLVTAGSNSYSSSKQLLLHGPIAFSI